MRSRNATPNRWSSEVAFGIAFSTLPIAFVGVLVGWQIADHSIASQEVSTFIANHQAVVIARSADPRVHAFSLSRDPQDSAILRIHIDVDNRETFDLVEQDIGDIWQASFTPKWDFRIRSGEKPNDLGYMAMGIGIIGTRSRV